MLSIPTRIVVNDYAAQAFPLDLSEELARRGHEVVHIYAASQATSGGRIPSTPAELASESQSVPESESESDRLTMIPVADSGRQSSFAHVRYGLAAARVVRQKRATVTINVHVPVAAQLVMRSLATSANNRSVLWLEGLPPPSGRTAVRLMRAADRVIVDSEELVEAIHELGVDEECTSVVESWAPIGRLPVRRRNNWWSREHGLDDKVVFLYSGTLGVNHRPDALLELARTLHHELAHGCLVVAGDGVGVEWLAEALEEEPELTNVQLLPSPAFDDLADVHAAADVLVLLLDGTAAPGTVPSRLRQYLCARRAVLGLAPAANPSSPLIASGAMAGLVSDDPDVFLADALLLARDGELRHTYGKAGRDWAEVNLSIRSIADRFEEWLAVAPEG